MKRECPHYQSEGKPAVRHSAELAQHEAQEEEIAFVMGDNGRQKANVWIIDSGASKHMTSDRKQLLNYGEFEKPCNISVGDGHIVNAIGEGDIYVKLKMSRSIV